MLGLVWRKVLTQDRGDPRSAFILPLRATPNHLISSANFPPPLQHLEPAALTSCPGAATPTFAAPRR